MSRKKLFYVPVYSGGGGDVIEGKKIIMAKITSKPPNL